MAMTGVPKHLTTMPRKRRPRASAGEVFISSKSLIYLMDDKPSSSQSDGGDQRNVSGLYENVQRVEAVKSVTARPDYSCSFRMLEANGETEQGTTASEQSVSESQIMSIYIGELVGELIRLELASPRSGWFRFWCRWKHCRWSNSPSQMTPTIITSRCTRIVELSLPKAGRRTSKRCREPHCPPKQQPSMMTTIRLTPIMTPKMTSKK